jgi:hypothetical protein
MAYVPFYEKFPEIAEKETRVITSIADPELPAGKYVLIDAYCNDAGCDCRRVFFNVMCEETGKLMAVIAYGWESPEFYAKWYGRSDPKIINELKGPVLNAFSPQSKLAPVLLKKIEEYAISDKQYMERIKRHYSMFRDLVDKESDKKAYVMPDRKVKISRNEPCPCGSGKKCCMEE